MAVQVEPITDDAEAPPPAGRPVLRVVLLAVIAVAALAIAGSAGWLAARRL